MATSKEIFDQIESADFDSQINFAREQSDVIDEYLHNKYNDPKGEINQVFYAYFIYKVIVEEGDRPNKMFWNYFNACSGYTLEEMDFYNLITNIDEEKHFDDFEDEMFADGDFCDAAVIFMAICDYMVYHQISIPVRRMLEQYYRPEDRSYNGRGYTQPSSYQGGASKVGFEPGGSMILGIILGLLLSWIGIIIGAVLKKKKTFFGTLIGFGLQIVLAVVVYLVILPMLKK